MKKATKNQQQEEPLCKTPDCIHWRGANGNDTEIHFCHCLLTTGKRRVVEDGVCKSYIKPAEEECRSPLRIPVISTDQDGNEVFYPSVTHAAKSNGLWQNQITRAIESGRPCQGKLWRKAAPDEKP